MDEIELANEYGLLSESFELNYLFPGRKSVFESIDCIRSFSEFISEYDRFILKSIGVSAYVDYELEDITYGSLRTKIAQFLRDTPDEAIKELSLKKLIGHYLLKCKYRLLKWLESNPQIDSRKQLEVLGRHITQDANALKDNGIIPPEINFVILVIILDKGQSAFNKLREREELEFKSDFGTARVPPMVNVDKAKLLSELGERTYETTTFSILKLKKIELLDNMPKWTFLQERKQITALITDEAWLKKYHNREINILPEDCMKVDLRTVHTVVPLSKKSETTYEVAKVYEVVPPSDNQVPLFV